MTDEIFRDGFCDDIFRSMKAQMEPSDDVVASLLAQIAAEAPSPVTENDNVIPFRKPVEIKAEETAAAAVAALESTPRKHFASKKTNKSIWYYGTAVAASIIVMISTFALLDTDGDDASGVKDLFEQAVGPNTQIVTPDNDGTEEQLPDDGEEPAPAGDKDSGQQPDDSAVTENPDDKADNVSPDTGKEDGNTPTTQTPDGSGSSDATGNQNQVPDTDETGKNDTPANGKDDSNDNRDESPKSDTSSDADSNTAQPDNSKVTPGSNGAEEIPWTNEIIGTSQVASISVSGGNYVVENTVSRSDVGETIEIVTITLPQTSTTNAAEVRAKVRELKNVSAAAMVALDVEGFDQPLVYANMDYSPATLGQFVSDLGLEKQISFSNTVRCQISKVGYSSNHSYNVDVSSAAWTWLLSQSKADRANYNSFTSGNAKALFTSESNPTGSQIQFGVSDNGYLYVSMLGNKYTFYVGSENAKGFIEYVIGEPLE